ncbi:MAG: saccharopine dehydrogenase NADP-binding domain-containing protein [Thermomicrobiales bacterium]|nr:saccharopine dehydrogenase NADP-binding domain-containing protein [Thermomicrobiales bacterium]
MHKVLVVGAGRVGRTLFHMLSAEPGYLVRLGDLRPEAAAAVVAEVGRGEAFAEPTGGDGALERALDGMDAVISAAPFTENRRIAAAAARLGVHYLDLTEDVQVTRFVKELADAGGDSAFVPQCGVAPGFITLVGMHLVRQFDSVDTLTLRVGALPDQPNNRLKYNLTWSTEGLVNEYLHPCEALRGGELVMVPPLEGKEEIIVDGVAYEAFTTSGGVGTLCHTLAGKVRRLDYKTMRYPGHLELIRFLLDDLRFREHPEELVRIFHRSIPTTRDDVVIVSARALGQVGGQFVERTWWRRVGSQPVGQHVFTGIELSTAAGVAGPLHLLLEGRLPTRGLVKLEDVPFDEFLASPFGRYYGRA